MPDKIVGGYYIKARKIKNSPVHKMPPHVREIWDYCLREANHKVGYMGPYKIERGQMIRDYSEIREDLSWYIGYRKMMYDENHTKKAMKALRDAEMITTMRVPGGVLISVLNYDFYNDPKNYVSTDESTNDSTAKALSKHQGSTTYNKKNKKKENKEYSEDSIEFRLSVFLLKHIRKNKPDYKEPNLQNWAKQADLMLNKDGRNLEVSKKLIAWVQNDEFEKVNVLSVKKLRDRFDHLELKMKESKPNHEQDDGSAKAQRKLEKTRKTIEENGS